MFDWLYKTDPTLVFTVLGAVGAWAYHKVKGDKKASIQDQLLDVLRHAASVLVDEIIASPGLRDTARAKLEWAADAALDRLHVKRNAVVDAIVEAAIGKVLAELAWTLTKHDLAKIERSLGAAANAQPPAHPTVPPLDITIEPVAIDAPSARAEYAAGLVRAAIAKAPVR